MLETFSNHVKIVIYLLLSIRWIKLRLHWICYYWYCSNCLYWYVKHWVKSRGLDLNSRSDSANYSNNKLDIDCMTFIHGLNINTKRGFIERTRGRMDPPWIDNTIIRSNRSIIIRIDSISLHFHRVWMSNPCDIIKSGSKYNLVKCLFRF